jgi:RNA-directed DNA polymerase
MFETKLRTVPITTQMVKLAYRKVKSNKGGAGVDKESLEDFQRDLSKNLYKIWNRLSSGSYFPKPLREVVIPNSFVPNSFAYNHLLLNIKKGRKIISSGLNVVRL